MRIASIMLMLSVACGLCDTLALTNGNGSITFYQIPAIIQPTNGVNGASGANGATGSSGTNGAIVFTYFTNGIIRPLVTTAAAANGFLISSNRNSLVSYSIKVITTSSIVAGQEGYVYLETCSSNSATAADWKEIQRTGSGNSYTLAVAIQGVMPQISPVTGLIQAGYYARLRQSSVSGAPTFSVVGGQEAN